MRMPSCQFLNSLPKDSGGLVVCCEHSLVNSLGTSSRHSAGGDGCVVGWSAVFKILEDNSCVFSGFEPMYCGRR